MDVDAQADAPWHDLAKRWISDIEGLKALEIGCGRGGFSAWLHDLSPKLLVAADLSAVAVEKASLFCKDRPSIAFMVSDIQRLPCSSESFDLVISCETVEHVPAPLTAAKELARLLKPGGRLVLTTPNYLGPMGLFRMYRRMVGRPFTESGQPLNNLTFLPRTCSWVRKAGLIVEHAGGSGHYIPWPRREPIRIRALDHQWPVIRSVAHHSIVVARKPKAARRL